MALCLKTSRISIHCLKSKMGLLSMIKQSSCLSSLTHPQKPPFPARNAQNFGDSDANFRMRATLFSARRFKSVKPEKQLCSLDNVDHNQVHPACELLFFLNLFICFWGDSGSVFYKL
jgi:hypothetical protein